MSLPLTAPAPILSLNEVVVFEEVVGSDVEPGCSANEANKVLQRALKSAFLV